MADEIVTGIVLAGGRSSRMGTDKALMLYKGRPLIEHAVGILREVSDMVVISANTDNYSFTGCEIWPDAVQFNAAMAGIYSCIRRSATTWNVVLSCDMPLVDPGFLHLMLKHKNDSNVLIPVHEDGHPEPLCAIYNRNVLHAMEQQIRKDNYSLRQLLFSSSFKSFPVSRKDRFRFANVNTTQDFDLLDQT